MKENKLIIAAAGAGKTTFLVEKALTCEARVLITTFTNENEAEIHDKFLEKCGFVPENVTIQPWFSFLLEHGVRPYQGTCNPDLFGKRINGVYLTNKIGGIKYYKKIGNRQIPVLYKEDEEFLQHYFTNDNRIYTDKIAKFVVRANERSNGNVIDRISRIYPNIFIDEVQDLAGYDLEIVRLLFHGSSSVICVGDPRQVTYYTHLEKKHQAYKHGMVKQYVEKECYKADGIVIDENSLSYSHRNNKDICDFSFRIYPEYPRVQPCQCEKCHPSDVEHQGIYVVKHSDLERYLSLYRPIQLRYNVKTRTQAGFSSYNFGQSKGKTYNRVIIYPTSDMVKWLIDNQTDLAEETRAKLYVAVTRARYSVAFVIPDNIVDRINGITVWSENPLF